MGGLWAAAVLPSQALRPGDAHPPRARHAAEVHRRDVSKDQAFVAGAAREDGVAVMWQWRLGTPRQVRGQDLGRRRLWMGGHGLSVKAGGRDGQDAIAVLDNLSGLYGVRNAAEEFIAHRVEKDSRGARHIRVRQVYRKLRVVGGEVLVHFDAAGAAREVNGTYVADLDLATEPKLTGLQALAAAQADQSARGNPAGQPAADPELVVFAHETAPRLAYEVTLVYDDGAAGPGRWRYWIDAADGTIILSFNDIKNLTPTIHGAHATLSGSLLAGEGGTVANVVGWHEDTGNYFLYNTNRSWSVYNIPSGSYSYRSSPSWGTTDRAEVSAAVAFDHVQNYFAAVHGRNSFDNDGMFARANVHQGSSYVNAYWDGLDFHFGDGDGVEANALGVLDVCGHEFTHAITDYTAQLAYQGESGALNESISDIFGACIEFHYQPNDENSYPNRHAGMADWLVGEDAWISTKALRDLRCPSNSVTVGDGNELPTRYLGTYWYFGSGDNGGVHYNSGVQNFFFYLLCEGGSGNNDGVAYDVTGIGLTNAERVAYLALTSHMTAYTDYEGARDAWVSAATDLDPAWSTNVAAAWAAVGVGPAPNTVAAPRFFPPEDTYVSSLNVTMTTDTAGATIYYTLNGDEPTTNSPVYTSPVPLSSTTTVKAMAWREGMLQSPTVTATYLFLGSRQYFFSMDSNPGWSISGGQWAFGQPLGGGGAHGSPDPTSGYTGANVYGYNLAGDYANSLGTTYWLTTTPMDLSAVVNCRLVFYRWLGVEQPFYDHAYIEVSNNGSTWTRIWANSAEVADSAWTRVVLDISSVADGASSVYVRWGMGRTDGSWTYCGWNIDDVAIWADTVSFPAYEGDVAPRPNGNGAVSLADWTQVGRFAAGLDAVVVGNEFQKADCAPSNTLGDGSIGIADWVQAGRYAAGLDPLAAAGGPSTVGTAVRAGAASAGASVDGGVSVLSVGATTLFGGQPTAIPINLQGQGSENAMGFSLSFDPAVLRFVSAQTGSVPAGAVLNVNTNQSGSGRIGFALALPAGRVFPAGTGAVVRAYFTALGGATSVVGFADQPMAREVADVRANALDAAYTGDVATVAQNLALASRGSTITGSNGTNWSKLIDGITTGYTGSSGYGYTVWTGVSGAPGQMTLDLKSVCGIGSMRLLLWNNDSRYYRYKIEASVNGSSWTLVVNRTTGNWQGWQELPFGTPIQARYLRLTGTYNSANAGFHVVEWQVYGTVPAPTHVMRLGGDLAFGILRVGSSAQKTLTIFNDGNSMLNVTGITYPTGFSGAWSGVVGVGGSQNVTVTFSPPDTNSYGGTVTVVSDATNGANTLSISGTGTNGSADINLALASRGSTITGSNGANWGKLIDGVTNGYTGSSGYGYTVWKGLTSAPGKMTLDLRSLCTIGSMRMLLWNLDSRYYRYKIEASVNGSTWTLIVNRTTGNWQGWQNLSFGTPVQARYLRLTGTYNSVNAGFHVVEWEVYGTVGIAALKGGIPPSKTALLLTAPSGPADRLPVDVLTSGGASDAANGWHAVDGDTNTAWQGQSGAGGWWLALTYDPVLPVSNLVVDWAEGSRTNLLSLHSLDATNWFRLQPPLTNGPVDLKYLWLIFPADPLDTNAVPAVREIWPE